MPYRIHNQSEKAIREKYPHSADSAASALRTALPDSADSHRFSLASNGMNNAAAIRMAMPRRFDLGSAGLCFGDYGSLPLKRTLSTVHHKSHECFWSSSPRVLSPLLSLHWCHSGRRGVQRVPSCWRLVVTARLNSCLNYATLKILGYDLVAALTPHLHKPSRTGFALMRSSFPPIRPTSSTYPFRAVYRTTRIQVAFLALDPHH